MEERRARHDDKPRAIPSCCLSEIRRRQVCWRQVCPGTQETKASAQCGLAHDGCAICTSASRARSPQLREPVPSALQEPLEVLAGDGGGSEEVPWGRVADQVSWAIAKYGLWARPRAAPGLSQGVDQTASHKSVLQPENVPSYRALPGPRPAAIRRCGRQTLAPSQLSLPSTDAGSSTNQQMSFCEIGTIW